MNGDFWNAFSGISTALMSFFIAWQIKLQKDEVKKIEYNQRTEELRREMEVIFRNMYNDNKDITFNPNLYWQCKDRMSNYIIGFCLYIEIYQKIKKHENNSLLNEFVFSNESKNFYKDFIIFYNDAIIYKEEISTHFDIENEIIKSLKYHFAKVIKIKEEATELLPILEKYYKN